jgi:hypothetical protein
MSFVFFVLVTAIIMMSCGQTSKPSELVYVDEQGTIRWTKTKNEVALFGANYCLPSACDYRAAGLFTDDRKKAVDQDMAHFARMEWDALRLCLWVIGKTAIETGT